MCCILHVRGERVHQAGAGQIHRPIPGVHALFPGGSIVSRLLARNVLPLPEPTVGRCPLAQSINNTSKNDAKTNCSMACTNVKTRCDLTGSMDSGAACVQIMDLHMVLPVGLSHNWHMQDCPNHCWRHAGQNLLNIRI